MLFLSQNASVITGGGATVTTDAHSYHHDFIALTLKTQYRIFDICSALYQKGLSLRDIQEKTGIAKTTIKKALNKGGLSLRNYKNGSDQNLKIQKTCNRKTCGYAPYGWAYLDGVLVIDPKEHLILRKILLLSSEKKSNQEIATILNEKKFLTRRGNKWDRGVVRTIINRESEHNNKQQTDLAEIKKQEVNHFEDKKLIDSIQLIKISDCTKEKYLKENIKENKSNKLQKTTNAKTSQGI